MNTWKLEIQKICNDIIYTKETKENSILHKSIEHTKNKRKQPNK